MLWNKNKSKVKAKSAATSAAQGAGAGGGAAAAILAAVRAAYPDALPWSVELDAAVVVIMSGLGATVWAWLQTFFKDKAKHGGSDASKGDPMNLLAAFLVLVIGAGVITAGCQTFRPDGTVVRPDTETLRWAAAASREYGPEAFVLIQQIVAWSDARQREKNPDEQNRWDQAIDLGMEVLETLAEQAITRPAETPPDSDGSQ